MMTANEAADEYRSVLSELTRNDKTQINLLTILAEDYASYAEDIVNVIEETLNTCPVPLKIIMLYVVDSILKNIQVTAGYREQFAKKIVNMIVHVFKESDEKTRASIHRLRSTWTDIFPRSRLYMIDSKINAIDKAWPIINPNLQQTTAITTQTGQLVHVNPRFLNGNASQQQKQVKLATKVKEEQQSIDDDAQTLVSSTTIEPSTSTNLVVTIQNNKAKVLGKQIKKEKIDEKQCKKNNEPVTKKLKQDTSSSRIPKKTTMTSKNKCDNSAGQKPESLLSLRVMPPTYPPHQSTHSKANKPPNLTIIPPPVKRARTSRVPPLLHQLPKSEQHGTPQKALEPTAALGAHAFVCKALPSTTKFTEVQHNIQNVTPRLPGVPENNRIFVDGKAYEVFYLDQVAVIERNGLPHRVSFAGPPRDVIIDGVAHRMAFGEQKQVLIDGEVHLLNFGAPSRELYMGHYPFKGAFGGPPIIATINGRRHEIRLCGPPPEVRIDPEPSYELMRFMPAIRQQQQSQQQVSPKIEPKEPTLDVTSLLKRLKNSGILTKVNEAERKSHERLVALEAKGQAIGRSNSPPVPCSHRLDHIERRQTPVAGFDQFSMRSLIIRYDSIIDSIHRQRKSCQHCGIGFQELYGEAYQRHVDWHLQDTLKMKDPRHKYRRSQPWYMLNEWFNYSETELVNRSQNAEAEKSTAAGGIDDSSGSPEGGKLTMDVSRDAQSDSIETKECQMCHEQFEEYWDEEEDVWRLRDCIISDGKTYHSYCRDDDTDAICNK